MLAGRGPVISLGDAAGETEEEEVFESIRGIYYGFFKSFLPGSGMEGQLATYIVITIAVWGVSAGPPVAL